MTAGVVNALHCLFNGMCCFQSSFLTQQVSLFPWWLKAVSVRTCQLESSDQSCWNLKRVQSWGRGMSFTDVHSLLHSFVITGEYMSVFIDPKWDWIVVLLTKDYILKFNLAKNIPDSKLIASVSNLPIGSQFIWCIYYT